MKPIERIVAVKDRMFADLDEIKRNNQEATEQLSQTVATKNDELKTAVKDLNEAVHEQTGKLNWQLVSAANALKEIRDVLYEYCVPTQDPYSYTAGTGAYRLETPELSVLQHLRAYLPTRNVIEVGAGTGRATELLLSAGYRVYSFEANAASYESLCDRFEGNQDFKGSPIAVGGSDGVAQLHTVKASQDTADRYESDLNFYSTTVKHAMPDGIWYAEAKDVQLKTLQSLHQSRHIPLDAAIVHIDCEGGDLDVIRGMGKNTYSCVTTKFWDAKHHFSDGSVGLLPETVAEMRKRGYIWHIVIYRIFDGEHSSEARFYTNIDQSVEQSWGHCIFFRDFALFTEAMKWCTANIRQNETFR